MDVMIEFTGGGPLDGKVLASDGDPDFDANKANWILRLAGASLAIAERKEERPGTLLTWRLKSPMVVEKANAEQWPEAKLAALVPYYEYHIRSFDEADGLVIFKAHWQGHT